MLLRCLMRKEIANLKAECSEPQRLRIFRGGGRGRGGRGRGNHRGGAAVMGPPSPPQNSGAPCFTCGTPGCRPGICTRCILPRQPIQNPDLLSKIKLRTLKCSKALSRLLHPRASVASPIGLMLAITNAAVSSSKKMTASNSRKHLPYNILNT